LVGCPFKKDIKDASCGESFVKNPTATKTRTLFFYPSIAGYSRGEENRQLEKRN
jgi:hypothetical protein